MKKVYLANAFSLQMVSLDESTDVHIYPMTIGSVKHIYADKIDVISAIGHADTAAVVSSILGQSVPTQRINIKLEEGDLLVVAQLTGGRLPEGSTTLPEGFSIKFVGVTIRKG